MNIVSVAGTCLGSVLGLYSSDLQTEEGVLVDLLNFADVDLPSAYIAEECTTDLHEVHRWLIDVTQEKFYARQEGEERWEMNIPQWIKDHSKEVFSLFEKLGLCDEVYLSIEGGRINFQITPQAEYYDYGVILGSTGIHVEKTIKFFADIIKNGIHIEHVFLLTGEREAVSPQDGSEEYLEKIAQDYHISRDKITETNVIKDKYVAVMTKQLGSADFIPYTVIDTPKGNKQRPTTITTFTEFSEKVSLQGKRIVVFGASPFIIGQMEDILKVKRASGLNMAFWGRPASYLEVQAHDGTIGETASIIKSNSYLANALAGWFYGGRERVSKLIDDKKYSARDEF